VFEVKFPAANEPGTVRLEIVLDPSVDEPDAVKLTKAPRVAFEVEALVVEAKSESAATDDVAFRVPTVAAPAVRLGKSADNAVSADANKFVEEALVSVAFVPVRFVKKPEIELKMVDAREPVTVRLEAVVEPRVDEPAVVKFAAEMAPADVIVALPPTVTLPAA